MKFHFITRIFNFYYQGFKSMTWGRSLWLVIIVKIFIMFAILKFFFFQDFLNAKFENEKEKGNYVLEEITK